MFKPLTFIKQLADSIQYRFCFLTDLLNPVNNFIENDKFTIQMKGMLFFESSAEDRRKNSLTLGQYLWERDDRDFIISVGKKNELKTEVKSEVEHVLIIKVRPNNICQISNASVNANSSKLKEVCIQLMLFYMNQRLPFNEEITLDEDFVVELNQTTALPVEEDEK
uniref:Uncharacterized protein n=1 Tax=Panagrolaimus davidi TaxID=227884 RepID=A0A914PLY3_9BILA